METGLNPLTNQQQSLPSREGAAAGSIEVSGFPFPLSNSVRRVFPSTASNGPSVATFDEIPRLKCRPHPPHESILYANAVAAPRKRVPPRDYPFENLSVSMPGMTPNNGNTSTQRPLARHRVMFEDVYIRSLRHEVALNRRRI